MSRQWACLRAEFLKGKNSFALWLSLVGTAANVFMFSLYYLFRPGAGTLIAEPDPWRELSELFFNGIAFMMLPLYVIILCSLVTFQEHRNGTWTNLYTLPVSRWDLYWSKQLYILLHFIGAHLLFILGMLLSGLLIGLLAPSTQLLSNAPPLLYIGELGLKTITSILGLLAFHTWISWRFRHFIVPLTIGILGFVLASLLGPEWSGAPWLWYATPISYMPSIVGAVQLPTVAGIGLHYWTSAGYFVLFTGIGYWDVGRI